MTKVCRILDCTLSFTYVQYSMAQCNGIPDRLASANNHAQPLSSAVIPTAETAVQQFIDAGQNLTLFSPFGSDSLFGHSDQVAERERQFYSSYSDFVPIFRELRNGHTQLFEGALQLFLQLTEQLANNACSSFNTRYKIKIPSSALSIYS